MNVRGRRDYTCPTRQLAVTDYGCRHGFWRHRGCFWLFKKVNIEEFFLLLSLSCLLSFHGRFSIPYDIFVRFESLTLLQWTCILHFGHTAHPSALRTNSDVGPVLLSTWPVRALLLEIVLKAPFPCWKSEKCFCDLLCDKMISCISMIIYNQNY